MIRFALIVVLALGASLATPSSAHAARDWWGWLEEFSGPGPFRGPVLGASLGQMLCQPTRGRAGLRLVPGTPPASDNALRRCIWFDVRFLHAGPEAGGFPAINAYVVDAGPAYSWRGLVTFGAGVGVVRLEADLIDESHVVTEFLTTGRLTVSPLRIVAEGIGKFLTDKTPPSPQWLGLFKLYYKPSLIIGRFSGADLGVPDVPCDCGNEWLNSYGISFDFLELTGFGT